MELVFVIIVIGILAAVIAPRMERDPLREAAIQLVSDIRYTQHLALVDDKYDATNANWYRSRWQIMFENSVETNNKESYTIFSDAPTYTGNADASEIATNPQDKTKKLTGGTTGIVYNDKAATPRMNLGQKYGVTSVSFSSSCQLSGSKRIAFDFLGRPLKGSLASAGYTAPYPNSNRLITSDCNITLAGSGESVIITVTPETGYTYISN